jgi:hypothetical protein
MLTLAIASLHLETGFPPSESACIALAQRLDCPQSPSRPLLSRAQSLCARLALATLLPPPFAPSQLTAAPGGRPVLPPRQDALPPPDLSLTHDGSLAAAVLSAHGPVGLDLQKYPSDPARCLALARRYFFPDEAARLAELPAKELPAAFTALWARKEATVKRSGEGLSALSRASGTQPPPGTAFRNWILTAPDGLYHLAACIPQDLPVRLVLPENLAPTVQIHLSEPERSPL